MDRNPTDNPNTTSPKLKLSSNAGMAIETQSASPKFPNSSDVLDHWLLVKISPTFLFVIKVIVA